MTEDDKNFSRVIAIWLIIGFVILIAVIIAVVALTIGSLAEPEIIPATQGLDT